MANCRSPSPPLNWPSRTSRSSTSAETPPIRSRRSRTLGRVAAIAALLSTAVEITQYALAVGRVSSTDDVLLNTAGAVVGALLTRNWWRPRSTDRPETVPASTYQG
ncbi:VanZ family protein [Streptomyces niveiscabiei]|uniref:VanZ family protein n=1 Tax=Streptomyces niveiscabiei TaxID=164115 RepID=UPI0029A60330|nr:VanZ family protein [Streptomyces niveiscabiei]MDX3385650.1 VanZ family protein [Streptomyces niveiscabiei]